MEITKRTLALTVGATVAVAGSVGVGTALAANPVSSGQSCSPRGAVHTTSSQTLLCGPTPSDGKNRWRKITIAGPKGNTGPQGPQGPAGPAGSGGGQAQTAKYIDTPITPQHFYFRLTGWTPSSWDDGKTYYAPQFAVDNDQPTVKYEVPDGYRVLSASIVDKYQRTSFAGLGPVVERVTGLTPDGATTYTWDGTPVDAKTFSGSYGFIESAICQEIPDPNPAYGCPYPDSDSAGRHTYVLRLLVDTNTPGLPTPIVTEIPSTGPTPTMTTLTPTATTTTTTRPPTATTSPAPPTTTTPPPPPPPPSEPPPPPPTVTSPPPVP